MDKRLLKPCPFCGSDDAQLYTDDIQFDSKYRQYTVHVCCNKCNASGSEFQWHESFSSQPLESCIQNAVDAWNTRFHAVSESDKEQFDLSNIYSLLNLALITLESVNFDDILHVPISAISNINGAISEISEFETRYNRKLTRSEFEPIRDTIHEISEQLPGGWNTFAGKWSDFTKLYFD